MIGEKKKKEQLDRPAEGVHVRVRISRPFADLRRRLGRCRSLSKSVVFGFFKFLAS